MISSQSEQKQTLINLSTVKSMRQDNNISQALLKYLPIVIILLLTLGNHLQSKDIENISHTLKVHLQVDPYSLSEYVNKTLAAYNLRMKVVEKEIELYKKSIKLDVINQMEFLNHSITNMSKVLEQFDESISALQTHQMYVQFEARKTETLKIIENNETIQSFGDQYGKYSNQFELTLNNIKNPYYNLQLRRNHTDQMNQLLQEEYLTYQSKYNIDKYNYEISMCVVVPTRNNVYENRYVYNIQSILNQNYSNYFIVVVDDKSQDNTGILIERYLRRQHVSSQRAIVVKRNKREGSLTNMYYAVHNHCKNYTIVLEVDGDDQLIGNNVFKLFNAVYQSKNPGFAYSNHVYYSQDEGYISKGYSEAYSKLSIEKQNYRKIIQKFGHLRSFRTQLFLKIKDQDLRDAHGQFFLAAGDEAYIFPILEMSCKNIEYIDEVTYLYNGGTGNNVRRAFKRQQQQNAIFIRLLKKYTCLPLYQNPLLSIR